MDKPDFTIKEFIKYLERQDERVKNLSISYIDLSNPLWTDNDWEITIYEESHGKRGNVIITG